MHKRNIMRWKVNCYNVISKPEKEKKENMKYKLEDMLFCDKIMTNI